LPLNYAQYNGVDLENGDRISTTYMLRHFTLYIDVYFFKSVIILAPSFVYAGVTFNVL